MTSSVRWHQENAAPEEPNVHTHCLSKEKRLYVLNAFISKLLFFINLIMLLLSFSFLQILNDHETDSSDFRRIFFSFFEAVKRKTKEDAKCLSAQHFFVH